MNPTGGSFGGKASPGLHVVAVPIGNLGDLSPRAREVLAGVDRVACEDTRVTGKLLSLIGIKASLVRYDDHVGEKMRPKLVAALGDGTTSLALVTDAGTPLVSDPGYKLVRACHEAGIKVHTVPGPSAPLAALALAGLPSDRFFFLGFPPPKSSARRRFLEEVAGVRATLILFEGASRLAGCLEDMAAVLGNREAAVARELTKLHEELRRGSLGELAAHYHTAGPPKGEIVIVVGPPLDDDKGPDLADVDRMLLQALAGGQKVSEAAREIATATGLARRDVYQRALALADGPSEDAE